MSALGNGSLSGSDFKQGTVLPSQTTTATQPVPTQYNSKLVGGKKKRLISSRSGKHSKIVSTHTSQSNKKNRLSSLGSVRNMGYTYKLYGGKKSRKNRRKSKKCMSFWPF
uniref:Uncharacterized protein n=1 Tax=viral metagenome TaxID=1070528 RepID=A0A6C0LBL9_9ZZZZ